MRNYRISRVAGSGESYDRGREHWYEGLFYLAVAAIILLLGAGWFYLVSLSLLTLPITVICYIGLCCFITWKTDDDWNWLKALGFMTTAFGLGILSIFHFWIAYSISVPLAAYGYFIVMDTSWQELGEREMGSVTGLVITSLLGQVALVWMLLFWGFSER